MNANERESDTSLDGLAATVIGTGYEVSNVLAGFLEKVYESPRLFSRFIYKGQQSGDYMADLLVEDQLIVELKCVDQLSSEHMAQCINYLRASHRKLALLINFQKPKVQWKRIVYNI